MDSDVNTGKKDLPTYVVIIIGVVCGVVVIILTIVLIYLCCKRRNLKGSDTTSDSHIKMDSNGDIQMNVAAAVHIDVPFHTTSSRNTTAPQLYTTSCDTTALNGKLHNGSNYWSSQDHKFDQPMSVHDEQQHTHDAYIKLNTTRDSADGSTGSDQKPKKIMYEVVV